MKWYLMPVLISVGFAQDPTAKFEVASIRSSPPGQGGRDWGPQSIDATPETLVVRNSRLTDCIKWAYNVQEFQVSGPSWFSDSRFDISAKAAKASPESEMRLMLQGLLADRFGLALHKQTQEKQVLVLTVAKGGHKLKAVDKEGSPSFRTGKLNLTGQGATLGQLTTFLAGELRVPILDQTGLTGRYDYFLDINSFVTDEIRKSMPRDGPP